MRALLGQGQKSWVKVKGRGQGHESRSSFWSAAVDIRGSALPSAAKSNNPKFASEKSHYQSKAFVCVSVIGSMDAVDRLLILITLTGSSQRIGTIKVRVNLPNAG